MFHYLYQVCGKTVGDIIGKIIGVVCPLCHEPASDTGFCCHCLTRFYHESSVCPICAELSPHAQICGKCQKTPHYCDAIFVSMELTETLLSLIHIYKYQRKMEMSGVLSKLMMERPSNFDVSSIDLIMSVPISKQHLWDRGFNQSHLLAKQLAKRYHKPLLLESKLHRIERPHQASLKYKERQSNIKGVFQFVGHQNLKGKTILIVDDITTTAATLNELAKAVKEQGASTVYAWALAKRTQEHHY